MNASEKCHITVIELYRDRERFIRFFEKEVRDSRGNKGYEPPPHLKEFFLAGLSRKTNCLYYQSICLDTASNYQFNFTDFVCEECPANPDKRKYNDCDSRRRISEPGQWEALEKELNDFGFIVKKLLAEIKDRKANEAEADERGVNWKLAIIKVPLGKTAKKKIEPKTGAGRKRAVFDHEVQVIDPTDARNISLQTTDMHQARIKAGQLMLRLGKDVRLVSVDENLEDIRVIEFKFLYYSHLWSRNHPRAEIKPKRYYEIIFGNNEIELLDTTDEREARRIAAQKSREAGYIDVELHEVGFGGRSQIPHAKALFANGADDAGNAGLVNQPGLNIVVDGKIFIQNGRSDAEVVRSAINLRRNLSSSCDVRIEMCKNNGFKEIIIYEDATEKQICSQLKI